MNNSGDQIDNQVDEFAAEWLVHGTVAAVAAQASAGFEAGGFVFESRTGPQLMEVEEVFTGELVLRGRREGTVASVVIRNSSGQRCTIKFQLEHWAGEENTTRAKASWPRLLDIARRRFELVGLAVEDMRAPGYKGPRDEANSRLAITKPSERSMWVDPVFFTRAFQRRNDLCFVLMPFREEIQSFYDNAVKPVVESMGLTCQLASDIAIGHQDVMEEIWIALNEARFLIADLTGQNANVLYELGIANTLGKHVIAIHRKVPTGEQIRLPFDVQSRRTIFYEDSAAGANRFRQDLRRHMETVLQSGT